jgi:replicative DNA helicase
MSDVRWKHISKIHEDGIRYMENRRDGNVKSILTPWVKFNEAGIGGLEWGSITTIAAQSGGGKTLITNDITTNAHQLNPDQDFGVLNFQFEMTNRATAVREFVSTIAKDPMLPDTDYKALLSVGKPVHEAYLEKIRKHCEKVKHRDIFQVDVPMTVEQMKICILDFYKTMNKPIIVTIDHSILIRKAAGEKDKFDSLYNLGEMLTELKKVIPVIFIVLTQMNRSIEMPERKIPGTAANYPNRSDIFGADALYQHSDILVAINLPNKSQGLTVYGSAQYVVNKHTLVMHFLKVRNGEPTDCFFEEDFKNMQIREVVAPPQHIVSLRTAKTAYNNPNNPNNTNFNP